MQVIERINVFIAILFFVCYAYQFFYIIVPFVKKHKEHKEPKKNRYAVLISARNEENVIGQLIESIKNQTYDRDLVTIFVVADNCTDFTAKICRDLGAVVYERENKQLVGKGYAMNFLLNKIGEDYPDSPFDGYFVFDADNVLDEHYIEEMNKTFSDGYKVITSYRNSKNFGDNWISAGYALWFLRESKYLNNSRMLLGTSCAVSGTGFVFSREIMEANGGWNFFLLTEDIEFTVHTVIDGDKIGYCPTAVLYDEQPTKFSQSWNQRLRWAKGFLQVFSKYGKSLVQGLFRGQFSCFDMTMTTMPAMILSLAGIIIDTCAVLAAIITANPVMLVDALLLLLEAFWGMYITVFIVGLITSITEKKNIHTTKSKRILYTFTFPLFMMTYIPISFMAFFKKVKWQPIVHDRAKSLDEIRNETNV